VGSPGLEKFDLKAADATADLQHRAFVDPVAGERLKKPSGGAGQSLAAIAACVSFHGLWAEDGAVAGGCAAAVHVADGLVAVMVARVPNFTAFWSVSAEAEQ
jgi:hypothetical protein